MTVISITITESTNQIVSGIPQTVSITTSIPSVIFYTLNNTDPTTSSTIYTGPITLPTDQLKVHLNVFADDGMGDTSPIIYNVYQTDVLGQNARTPYSGTTAQSEPLGILNPAPFGAPPIQPNVQFLGAGAAGLTVDDPCLPQVSGGFDANGNPTMFTNGQDWSGLPQKDFGILYSTANEEGETGPGIGTFPPHTVVYPTPPPEISNMQSPFFDPRALVVIYDSTQGVDPSLPIPVFREHATFENQERVRDGNQLYNRGLDAPTVSAAMTRPQYNPVDNSITYSWYDSWQNKWLFNKTLFQPKPTLITDYSSKMVFGTQGSQGMGSPGSRVYQWLPYTQRYLG